MFFEVMPHHALRAYSTTRPALTALDAGRRVLRHLTGGEYERRSASGSWLRKCRRVERPAIRRERALTSEGELLRERERVERVRFEPPAWLCQSGGWLRAAAATRNRFSEVPQRVWILLSQM